MCLCPVMHIVSNTKLFTAGQVAFINVVLNKYYSAIGPITSGQMRLSVTYENT